MLLGSHENNRQVTCCEAFVIKRKQFRRYNSIHEPEDESITNSGKILN